MSKLELVWDLVMGWKVVPQLLIHIGSSLPAHRSTTPNSPLTIRRRRALMSSSKLAIDAIMYHHITPHTPHMASATIHKPWPMQRFPTSFTRHNSL